MIAWKLHHRDETTSTNLDARAGVHGDVFTADYQTAGRGRLDHTWESPRGKNIIMSVVLSVEGLAPEEIATLPLVVGLAVAEAARGVVKWPNDVYVAGKKAAGILCERKDDLVIAGIGANVGEVPRALADRAIAVPDLTISAILAALDRAYALWRTGGFAAVYPALAKRDFLKGRTLAVRQTDDDSEPIRGLCGGISSDGSLVVGGVRVYAGEAHVEALSYSADGANDSISGVAP